MRAVAAFVRGLINSDAVGFSVNLGSLTHASSKGKRCWIARSRVSLLDLSLAALTMPSLPLMK